MGAEAASGETGEGERMPLLTDHPQRNSYGPNGRHIKRTGTVLTASAHIITALIGNGVLSLAWSLAQLGWIAGPTTMLCFAALTLFQSAILADCYRSPDPENGYYRNFTYMDAVRRNLGEKSVWFSGLFQQAYLFGIGIAYNITSATSMREIQKSACYHKEGFNAPCSYELSSFMLLFGAVQIFLSLIPDFHNMEWLSILAAIMSFSYSFLGFSLSFGKVIENGTIKGGIGGVPVGSASQKVWLVSQGLGDIAYAFPYSIILLEIQDTLKSPPPENQTMKKASVISLSITTFFYLCCGCFGYAAFGDDTPGNLLTGFGSHEPYWLIDFAHVCIVLHLLGGFQMYSQPVFAFADRWFSNKFPHSGFVNNFYVVQLPFVSSYRLNPLRLCFRTFYVVSTTGIAMLFPFFNEVLGVLGALSFWPLAVYFPVEMYFMQRKIQVWTKRWILLKTYSYVCLLVSLFALVGSIEGLFNAKLD